VRLAGTRSSPLDRLNEREREFLCLLAEGQTSVEIGERLTLSPRTVDNYRSAIMQKLGVPRLPGLVKFAFQHGLISLE
jgi:DNA-binding CsgD family transcriptional regulator